MKVKSEKPKFAPISIVLESQDEVDKVFAIFNYGPIADALRLPETVWESLRKLKTDDYGDYHNKIERAIKD